MPKRQVFFSFDYDEDVMRVAQVKNIGAIEGETIVSTNEWETIKRGGDEAIKRWIDYNMTNRSCLVVLIGKKTHKSRWVDYEIKKAWNDGKGIVGIYIHNLKDPRTGTTVQGENPFKHIYINQYTKKIEDSFHGLLYNPVQPLSLFVRCFEPVWYDAYGDIRDNLESLIEEAVTRRKTIN